MSTSGLGPEGDRDGSEPRLSQWGNAADRARVHQAGGNQYIVNLGNAAWVTVPAVVTVALVLVLYFVFGGAPKASGLPAPGTATPQARQSSSTAPAVASSTAPLTVSLAYDQHDVNNGMGSCMSWIFDRPLSAIPAPDGVLGASSGVIDETWAHELGGVDVTVTNFKLAIQGVTTTAVQLLGFRAVDVKRGPAIHGTDIISSDGCGPSPEAGFEIALGHNPPVITPVAGIDNGAAKKIPFPFVVSSTDIQQFQVAAVDSFQGSDSCNCDITWRLALDWSYEGKVGTTIIDDSGRPFQTFFPSNVSGKNIWFDDGGSWKRFA